MARQRQLRPRRRRQAASKNIPPSKGRRIVQRLVQKMAPHLWPHVNRQLRQWASQHKKLYERTQNGNQSGGSFMDKAWWTRLGKRMANTATTMGTFGLADVPYPNA